MNKIIQMAIVALLFLESGTSFVRTEIDSGVSNPSNATPSNDNRNWIRVESPIRLMKFARTDSDFAAVGEEGVITFNVSGEQLDVNVIGNGASYLSDDGGITTKYQGSKPADDDGFCSPESAVLIRSKVFIIAGCEHRLKVTVGDLDKNDPSWQFHNFTYCSTCEPPGTVDGPTEIAVMGTSVVFLSMLGDTTALMVPDHQSKTFYPIWKTKSEFGNMVEVNFIDQHGLMITSTGNILKSEDSGKSWKKYSEVPAEIKGRVYSSEFRNREDGFLTGEDAIVYSTVDGGKSWNREEMGISNDVAYLSVGDAMTAVSNDEGNIEIKVRNKWISMSAPEGILTDIQIVGNRIAVLVEGGLYISAIPD